MVNNVSNSMQTSGLQQHAEVFSNINLEAINQMSPEQILNLIKELHTEKKELELQNEELRRTQVELEKAQDKYRNLINLSPDPIVIIQDGYHKFINPAFTKLFGYTHQDVENGLNILEFGQKKKKAEKNSQLGDNLITNELDLDKDCFDLVSKNGDIVSCEASSSIIQYNGRPANLIIVRDISRRRQAEKEKARLEAQLQQTHKMEAIGTLAGGIAHDINNLLGIIVGNTEFVEDEIPECHVAQKFLQEIRNACQRGSDLVRRILTFNRKSEYEVKTINLGSLIKESLKLLRASIPTTIEIRQNIAGNLPTVLGDFTQLTQLVLNLCTNAAHAMDDEGGILEISLEKIELGTNDVKFFPDLVPGVYVSMKVSDNGCGIKPEIINRIFEPYFTTREIGDGTGMGLVLVNSVVKNHDGAISVYSEPGKGSTFQVLLPYAGSEAAIEKTIDELPARGTERILFIDDDAAMVKIGKKRLEKLGYEVETRTNSVEALELFRAAPDRFDLIISDTAMSGMTGDRLAEEAMKIRSDVPIILCTGYSEIITKEKAEQMGICAFLTKPIGISKMARTIRQALDENKDRLPAKPNRILLVSDKERMRFMLRNMLEPAGFNVMEAPDGEVALWLHKEEPVDLFVLDIVVSEPEKIETQIELKANFPEVKIVAISEDRLDDSEHYTDSAEKVGADRVLVQPFKREEILNTVKYLLY